MKVTLPVMVNGLPLTIDGNEAEINALLRALNVNGEYYHSSTHGLIRIKDMNTRHLINAVRKMYRDLAYNWASQLPMAREELVKAVDAGLGANDLTLVALLQELRTRKD